VINVNHSKSGVGAITSLPGLPLVGKITPQSLLLNGNHSHKKNKAHPRAEGWTHRTDLAILAVCSICSLKKSSRIAGLEWMSRVGSSPLSLFIIIYTYLIIFIHGITWFIFHRIPASGAHLSGLLAQLEGPWTGRGNFRQHLSAEIWQKRVVDQPTNSVNTQMPNVCDRMWVMEKTVRVVEALTK
jgi:hypothetical protein